LFEIDHRLCEEGVGFLGLFPSDQQAAKRFKEGGAEVGRPTPRQSHSGSNNNVVKY